MSPKNGRLPALNSSPVNKRANYASSNFRNSPDEGNSPNQVIEGFGAADTNEMVDTSQQYEGSVYLKTKEGSLKKHLMILIGNEIYFFRSR